ncbi:hypothetical protein V1514DRAFT_335984 [Lipomyces japonicus]|uniref:uncharacterized protein n=1 Tax=Lipomyces japonicus TaxID=56871 RepID=UPI0034CD35CF
MPIKRTAYIQSPSTSSLYDQEETYFSLPSESPPSPTSPRIGMPPLSHPARRNSLGLDKVSEPRKLGFGRGRLEPPLKLGSDGSRSNSLSSSLQSVEKSQYSSSWAYRLFFSNRESAGEKRHKFKEDTVIESETSTSSNNSSRKNSSASDDSASYTIRDSTGSPMKAKPRTSSELFVKEKMNGSGRNADGYFVQGAASTYSDYSQVNNEGLEQFPASTVLPLSPPESEKSAENTSQKQSWISSLFAKKDRPASDETKQKSPSFGIRPPSPPTSIMSSTSSVSTLRHNVNQSSTSLSSQIYSTPSRNESMTFRGYPNANTSSFSNEPEKDNNNTWAFWSRASSKDKKFSGQRFEDGVVAFSGPSSSLDRQIQGATNSKADDASSVMTSDTVFVNHTPQRNNLGRNQSRVSANSYSPSLYNGSQSNLNQFDPNYGGYNSSSKLNKADISRSNTRDDRSIRTADARSIRTIETISKSSSRTNLPAGVNTVQSASGAKEIAIMAPPPTNVVPNQVTQTVDPSSKKKSKKSKNAVVYPNQVIPKLEDSLPFDRSANVLWDSFGKIGSKLFGNSEPEFQHLKLTTPPRIKKAVAIGIHGFFPVRMVRSIIGEPTGTSVKFANEAALGIQRWAEASNQEVDIEKIALEGEGIVLDRVENLYRLLSNWMDHLHQADFIMVAAHSQGTPVAVQLVAKLIEEGHADNKKIGIVGMAGVSLGPFYGLDQKLVIRAYTPFESDSLKELFAFQNPESLQARRYIQGIRTVIAHGVKISFIGSVNDQLVPLYSAFCTHVNHPHIYRAIFVDGRAHAPSFIIDLITILTKLRNIGRTDHDIIKDISDSLAGTLTGGGHSMIYFDPAVYDVAIKFALESTNTDGIPVRVDKFEVPMPSNYNPYHLPWNVRGLLEEDFVSKTFPDDLKELLVQFDRWEPESKPLKEIKYRLSSIRFSNKSSAQQN